MGRSSPFKYISRASGRKKERKYHASGYIVECQPILGKMFLRLDISRRRQDNSKIEWLIKILTSDMNTRFFL